MIDDWRLIIAGETPAFPVCGTVKLCLAVGDAVGGCGITLPLQGDFDEGDREPRALPWAEVY